jgi:hypothetical protein
VHDRIAGQRWGASTTEPSHMAGWSSENSNRHGLRHFSGWDVVIAKTA